LNSGPDAALQSEGHAPPYQEGGEQRMASDTAFSTVALQQIVDSGCPEQTFGCIPADPRLDRTARYPIFGLVTLNISIS
jgi:hypothetical protein